MRLAPESLRAVETALAEYLKQPGHGDADFSARHQALPLHAGWTGTTYLTTSGEFWFRNFEYDPPRIESDLNESSKLVALIVAAERHPQLTVLLPSRPPDATTCAECDGKGQITIGNLSNIICGRCSGLGWLTSDGCLPTHVASYPSFEQALAKFRSFAAEQGREGQLAFLAAEHALLVGDQLFVTAEAISPLASVQREYARAVARRLGVAIGAVGKLPDGRLGVYVYGPNTENESERLMYPNGLKMMIPEQNVGVHLVGKAKMWLLRLRYKRRAAARTREYFR